MSGSRRHRTYNDPGHSSARSRGRARRSSSYDDDDDDDDDHYYYYNHNRDAGRPRRARHHHDDDDDYYYYSHPDDFSSDNDDASPRPRRARRAQHDAARPRRDKTVDAQLSRERRDQAIKSALTAGAVEAFRQRNRSGEWLGEKGLRVATAAVSAAAIDSAVDKNPRRRGTRNVIGSTLGGLVVDKLASGMGGGRR